MKAPANDLIALPKRLNAAACKALRDSLTFPDGYSNYYAKDKPYSATVNELMANHADAENHALIRDIMKTSIPVDTICIAISAYWFRTDYNILLHNTLLIINKMHQDGLPIKMNILSSAVGAITYPEKDENYGRYITTHSKLTEAVAIIRFITALGIKSANVKNRQIKTGHYYAVANPHLEALIRSNLNMTDEIIGLLKDRRIHKTKKGLTPVLLALHNEQIKELTKDAPEVMDKMFDYYYERNPGDASDLSPLLGYLDTAHAVSAGYL